MASNRPVSYSCAVERTRPEPAIDQRSKNCLIRNDICGSVHSSLCADRLQLFVLSIPELPSAGDRLAYAIKYDFLAGIMLLADVVCVAQQRFFSPEAMDGSRPPEDSSLDINLRYLKNTLEQYFLLVIGHLGLSLWSCALRCVAYAQASDTRH